MTAVAAYLKSETCRLDFRDWLCQGQVRVVGRIGWDYHEEPIVKFLEEKFEETGFRFLGDGMEFYPFSQPWKTVQVDILEWITIHLDRLYHLFTEGTEVDSRQVALTI